MNLVIALITAAVLTLPVSAAAETYKEVRYDGTPRVVADYDCIILPGDVGLLDNISAQRVARVTWNLCTLADGTSVAGVRDAVPLTLLTVVGLQNR